MITIDNLTIERGTANWGGPTATVTVVAGQLAGRVFTLRSTEGLERDGRPTLTLANGGGIHVDAGNPDSSHPDWRGVFRTYDMNQAIADLIDYLDELAVRDRVQEATWAETSAMREALEAFDNALGESSRLDWRDQLQQLLTATAALDLKVRATFDPPAGQP